MKVKEWLHNIGLMDHTQVVHDHDDDDDPDDDVTPVNNDDSVRNR